MSNELNTLAVPCSYCGAKVGQNCAVGSGLPEGYTHNPRVDRARKLAAREQKKQAKEAEHGN